MVHFIQDNQIPVRILKNLTGRQIEVDEAHHKVDVSKVVDLEKTAFVRAKQCLTRKINRLIKQHQEHYFEIGKSVPEPIYNYDDIAKLYVLAASKDAQKIEELYSYYAEKYVPRLKNLNKFRKINDTAADSQGYFYLYLVFLHKV